MNTRQAKKIIRRATHVNAHSYPWSTGLQACRVFNRSKWGLSTTTCYNCGKTIKAVLCRGMNGYAGRAPGDVGCIRNGFERAGCAPTRIRDTYYLFCSKACALEWREIQDALLRAVAGNNYDEHVPVEAASLGEIRPAVAPDQETAFEQRREWSALIDG